METGNRFVSGHVNGLPGKGLSCKTQVITDTFTGVQYLYISESETGSVITVLVDRFGAPYIDPSFIAKTKETVEK